MPPVVAPTMQSAGSHRQSEPLSLQDVGSIKWRKGKDMFLFHYRILNILALTAGVSCSLARSLACCQRRSVVTRWRRYLPCERLNDLHFLIGPYAPSVTVSGWLRDLPCLEPSVDGDARDAEPISKLLGADFHEPLPHLVVDAHRHTINHTSGLIRIIQALSSMSRKKRTTDRTYFGLVGTPSGAANGRRRPRYPWPGNRRLKPQDMEP